MNDNILYPNFSENLFPTSGYFVVKFTTVLNLYNLYNFNTRLLILQKITSGYEIVGAVFEAQSGESIRNSTK